MNDTATLAKAISAEKIERAKAASIEEKLLDGPRLFSQACEAMRAGLRVLRPGISDEEIEAAIWKRNYTR
jgi:hypothetical protein